MKWAGWLALVVGVLAVAVLVGGSRLRAWLWGSDQEIAVRVFAANVSGRTYDGAVTKVSDDTGAPVWYVRQVVPAPAVAAPCVRRVRNPVKTLNIIGGYIGGSIMAVIPITAPFGVATLALAAGIDAVMPATVERPCRS